jgi:hypothetical protein
LAALTTGTGDLKSQIRASGGSVDDEWLPGDPNDALYVKHAEHYLRTAKTKIALHYIEKALEFKPENMVI